MGNFHLALTSIEVSEFNAARNPVRPFIFRDPNGISTTVLRPDPRRALITGTLGGPPPDPGFFTNLSAFKIPTLWGAKHTPPYFHDNSAKTLEDVAAHYHKVLPVTPATLDRPHEAG